MTKVKLTQDEITDIGIRLKDKADITEKEELLINILLKDKNMKFMETLQTKEDLVAIGIYEI